MISRIGVQRRQRHTQKQATNSQNANLVSSEPPLCRESWGLGALAKAMTKKELSPTFDPDRDEALLHALLVIASWGAFEACVADFTIGMLKDNPHLLEEVDVLKKKMSVSDYLKPEHEKFEVIYKAIEESVGGGVDGYEEIFKILDLSDAVPQVIKDNIYQAQMVRNVWAHKAGIADSTFIRQAAHLGFNKGDLVAITAHQMGDYVSAILVYGQIIASRHRISCGLGAMPLGKNVKDSAYKDAYLTIYPEARPAEDDGHSVIVDVDEEHS